ncbi:DUF1553 domain-containing protein [Aporhodopirellula aestuarii]|uniref:DUF1553 domain-containing protein n=1 Tax=Aporhodopirellula aestuarii TaxID=2950107 RepID=A0ABT0U6T1_9BACT|nr:DUF1553 domain-containing protein [Aporhodopirellula aestuarii]MCM2372634.1 DUF1553 domain-containing protein [Aporhodopirellula aestuarii]
MDFIRSISVRFITPVAIAIVGLGIWNPVRAEIDFNSDVRPILSDKCFKCHGPDAANQESEFRVDSFEHATADLGGYFGIVPGDLDASEVHLRIHDEDSPMPPAGDLKKLTADEKAILDRWISEGAKFAAHWAFVPLPESVEVPDAGDNWAENPIDRFVANVVKGKGLTHAAPASREKWIRRVTFDLTGLPPTVAEIREFVQDESNDAYEKVVDRLLQSAACAERLTSEWLDVARYGDTYGYQRDDERFVWPYRDWVIDSFHRNMPYDEFVTWQLAGDLLPDATRDQKLATTFNRLHSHKKEGGVAIEEFRVENVADRTHTVGAAFLGLTMECCRCHDHKYDPLTAEDYYSMSAFFDDIDENGLISYFTDAVPTPAMPFADEEQQAVIDSAEANVKAAEARLREHIDSGLDEFFEAWLSMRRTLEPIPGHVVGLSMDELEKAEGGDLTSETGAKLSPDKVHRLRNQAAPNQDDKFALTFTENKHVDGKFGKAIELTGDDSIFMPGEGHFERHDPFSMSLWIWSPEVETRGVLIRRSRGWDDAGSIGYELTREGNKLVAKLCHFWPGDAIAIETTDELVAKKWTHVAMVYDGSSRADGLQIFIDGKPAATRVVVDHLTRNITQWRDGYPDLAIGERYRDRGFVGGRVDQFDAFDRQLSELEIAQLYDGQSLFASLIRPRDQLSEADRTALRDYYVLAVNEKSRALRKELREARVALNKVIDATPAITVMRESATPRQAYLLERGVYDQRGKPVDPRTPEFLPPMDVSLPRNRLGFARWLTHPDHPLTARVTVNRYWQMMFGTGLVRTSEDFGNQSEPPSHPNLLDWLARDFVNSGWDVRHLLRQIALSVTYGQTSVVSQEEREKDPENKYLARGTGQRLSAEMIRDNMLAASGLLVNQVGGPPVKTYDVALAYNPLEVDKGEKLYRRSLYTFWKRTSPAPVMMTLNTPTREVCRLRREITSTPLQALVLMNGSQFVEAARVMAGNLLNEHGDGVREMASDAFERLTSRRPTDRETEILIQLFDEQLQGFQENPEQAKEFLGVGPAKPTTEQTPAELAAATVLVSSIMNLDECVRHQ